MRGEQIPKSRYDRVLEALDNPTQHSTEHGYPESAYSAGVWASGGPEYGAMLAQGRNWGMDIDYRRDSAGLWGVTLLPIVGDNETGQQ